MHHFTAQEVQQLKNQLGNITKENKLLKDLLKKHSIAIPRKILTAQDSSSSASNNSGITNNSLTMASPKIVAVSAPVSMTMPKTLCAPVQVPVNAPVVTMVTQVPITSASVTSSTNDMSKKDSIAYVTPFIIGTNPISMTTSTVATASPVVQVATPLVAQNVASDPGQLQLNQPKQNSNSSSNYLSNSHQSVNPQATSDLASSSTPQALQTVNIPISSSQALQPSHAGFSQHSVAAIMKVTLQPGMSNSAVNLVNAVPLANPSIGNNSTAVLNVQPTVINTPSIVQNASTMLPLPPSVLPASSSILTQQANSAQIAASQIGSFQVTSSPIQNGVSLLKESQSEGAIEQQKTSNVTSKNLGSGKTKKSATANRASSKTSSKSQNTKSNSQSRASFEGNTNSASNKRRVEHLIGTNDPGLVKRSNALSSQESQGNMNVCQSQEEIITLQNFNVSALISGISPQGASVANIVPTGNNCGKQTLPVSTVALSQSVHGPRLSHSIASLAGLPQSIGQQQTSTDLHQHQQVSTSAPGNLSFSAESLLASSEVILPNIPLITTTSVSENSSNQPSSFTLAIVPSAQNTRGVLPPSTSNEQSVHNIHNEQSGHNTATQHSHTQSFSNYSAEALIGGSELIGDIAQESQIQSRPSRTTYSDFSAESLIGSSDLNSSLSYAIDNLISSRSDANFNSTAMVSVNPNLLHSVKPNMAHDVGSNSILATVSDLAEQKSVATGTQPTGTFNSNISNSAYGVSVANSAPVQFTITSSGDSRRTREGSSNQQGIIPAVNSISATSTSFLKHSVDSITSSFYAASNASSGFSLAPITTTVNSFQPQSSFGMDTLPASQLSFGSMANPFSQTRPFFTHTSSMGSFPV